MTGWTLATAIAALAGSLACLVVAFLLWRRGGGASVRTLVIAALGASAAVLLASASPAVSPSVAWLAETLRNLLWLGAIYRLFAGDGRTSRLAPLRPVIAALAMAEATQLPLVILAESFASPAAFYAIGRLSAALHMIFAIGMLVLVHNLYVGAGPQQRPALRHISGALVLAWGYELNLHALAYLAGGMALPLLVLRGIAWGGVAVLLYLDGAQRRERRFAPSRSVAFQSLSLLVIGLYLFALFLIRPLLDRLGVDAGAVAQFGAVILAVAGGAFLASQGLRARLREWVSRHFFRHRYDYRDEWRRFARTMTGGEGALPIEQRAIQVLADITDSRAGMLLYPDDQAYALAARWEWPTAGVPPVAIDAHAGRAMAAGRQPIALDEARAGRCPVLPAHLVPRWLAEDAKAWALIPLMAGAQMTAVVVLARPAYPRQLDWEDHELLAAVAQQLATHLSENTAQRALLEAARFDEFNRRIAFVMHDIKNLASQLGLMVENAERHMDNPAFRADMQITLRNSSDRLEKLLGRLSGYGGGTACEPEDVDARALLRSAAAPLQVAGRLVAPPGGPVWVRADARQLEQVLRHVMHNACDASREKGTVSVGFEESGAMIGIVVADTGCGMSAQFVRDSLFTPFVSTKTDGFGIGAFEAREMVRAMGGRVEVRSREGFGTRFTVWLPRAEVKEGANHSAADAQAFADERKTA